MDDRRHWRFSRDHGGGVHHLRSCVAGGVANAWAGRALQRRVANGRLVTLGLAVPNLFLLPFGTALGIYAFWVLLHNETRSLFEVTS
jgi:hypothetical protein